MAPARDPSHWLYRLTPEEWLAAAETELAHCAAALTRRAVRPGVTHARRAAGMALNALLVLAPRESWGRSYMEHLEALRGEAAMDVPDAVRSAAERLCTLRPAPPALVPLGGKPDLAALEAARQIVSHAQERVRTLGAVPGGEATS